MTLVWTPGWNGLTEPEAVSYVAAVEQLDGQPLEFATAKAINDFVLGCKNDGIWNAIKACCILAGARTLTGALVPLAGTAPTNVGPFVSGDYNRKTGLGDASNTTKYLNSNRNNNADPQDSNHNTVYVSTAATATSIYMSASSTTTENGDNNFGRTGGTLFSRSRTSSAFVGDSGTATGLIGINRPGSANYILRSAGANRTLTQASQTSYNSSIHVFAGPGAAIPTNARLAFYSIGESLDLALLDTRVTALINAFAVAIP